MFSQKNGINISLLYLKVNVLYKYNHIHCINQRMHSIKHNKTQFKTTARPLQSEPVCHSRRVSYRRVGVSRLSLIAFYGVHSLVDIINVRTCTARVELKITTKKIRIIIV